MEKIYSMNRSTLVRFETDGEYLNVSSNGQSIFDDFSINPHGNEQNFIRVRDKQHNIEGVSDKLEVKDALENNGKATIELSNMHFSQRSINMHGNTLVIEDKLNGPKKSAIFAWDFPISEDFQVLKNESTYSLLKVGDIIVEIKYTQDMIAHPTESGYRIKKRLNNVDEEIFKFEFVFKAPTQIETSSLEPETFKVQNQSIKYLLEENGHNTLDVILVPMPFTDIDFSNLDRKQLEACVYHIPYTNIIHERKTDKLYIFDVFNGMPTLFLQNYDVTTKLIRKLVSKTRKNTNVKVNLFGIDSSSPAARKMSEYEIFDSIRIINPLTNIDEHYTGNLDVLNNICQMEKFEAATNFMIENLVDDKVKYLVTPYERGYYNFVRAIENQGFISKLERKLTIIRSVDEQDNNEKFIKELRRI